MQSPIHPIKEGGNLSLHYINAPNLHYLDALSESRMKELSANDMEVWVFDTKRNAHVQKGRLEQEQQARRKEESILDLELDFLAPYFQR